MSPYTSQTRRDFLKRAGLGIAAGAFFAPHMSNGPDPSLYAKDGDDIKFAPAPKFEIIKHGQVSAQPNIFYGWPTIATGKDDELVVVASAREDHVDPFGRVALFRSRDLGETWTWPQIILDGPADDRDSGILITQKGTFLVTTFTEIGYYHMIAAQQERLRKGVDPAPGEFAITGTRYESWLACYKRMTPEQREGEMGRCWMIRSTNEGCSWCERFDVQVSSPHGPFQAKDGRILFPGRNLTPGNTHVHVMESKDDGISWNHLGDIPTRKGDEASQYHELHGAEASDGTMITQIRNHNIANCNETLQTESVDGGKTWSSPHSIGTLGFPSHLLRLADGRLLMTYSFRFDPVSERARVSEDNGKTWSEPITLWHIDDMGHDFGYPATTQLSDGSLVTVWYEVIKGTWIAVVRMTKWRLA